MSLKKDKIQNIKSKKLKLKQCTHQNSNIILPLPHVDETTLLDLTTYSFTSTLSSQEERIESLIALFLDSKEIEINLTIANFLMIDIVFDKFINFWSNPNGLRSNQGCKQKIINNRGFNVIFSLFSNGEIGRLIIEKKFDRMAYLLTYGIINQLRGNMDFQQLKLGINRLLIMNIDLTKRWLYTTKYTSILSDKPPILLFINHLKQETIRSLILDILFQVEPDNSSTKRDFDLLGELRYFETIWKLYWYQLKSEDSLEFIINLLTDAIYYKESEHFLEYVYKEEFLNDILNVLSCKNYKNIQKMIDFLDSLLQVLCYRSEKLMLLIREIKLYIHSNLDKIYSTLQYIENDSSIVFEEGKMIINDKVIPFIVPSNYPKCYKLTIKRYTFMSFFLSTDIIEKEKINLNIELIINCLEWLLLNPKNDMILSLNFKILEIIFSNFIRDKDNSYIDIISYLFIETRLVSRVKYQIIMNSRSGLNYLLAFVQFHLNAVINKLKEEGKGLNQSLLIELESCRESSFKEETIIYPKSQFYFPKSKNKFVKNNFFIKDDDFLI